MKILFAVALAAVASSTNYKIQVDSLNFAGQLSSSANYQAADTLGEAATGELAGTTYRLKAGYQNMLISSISISAPTDLSLTTISNSTGGQSSGSVAWTVTTDNAAGYTLAIKADTSPALAATGGNFNNYTPAGSVPDYAWSIDNSVAEFGFSPEGTEIASRYLDDSLACGVGSSETADRCWDALSTANRTIASRATNNTPLGTVTTVKFRAEIGTAASVNAGDYNATVTATALAS
ncbi:MAG: hypothetical protein AAB677_00785 [Patescibacteria group bacterium]